MENIFWIAFALFGFFFIFGVIYPLAAALIYPIYRRHGGRKSFRAYMKSL